jgi:NAD(P)-dependent dehydrogenase (short-subunit alcohol dehydrogenase family)
MRHGWIMLLSPFVLVTPGATRGLGVVLTRQFLRTTNLPVYATHRTPASDKEVQDHILKPLKDIDPSRLNLLRLDLTSEDSIASAANSLSDSLQKNGLNNAFIHTAFITGGILHPEKRPSDLDWQAIQDTFQINVISHMLIIKHFSRFLPQSKQGNLLLHPAKWVHVSARVGSIEDNKRGGWYSYRSSKAALNQVVKTFDLHLEQQNKNAICVGVHPGTVKTDLSRDFWESTARMELFEPMDAASNLMNVVENLATNQRGKVWDWAGKEIAW